jgi:urease accessory protein
MGAGSRVDPAPLVSVAGLPVLERVEAETDAAAMATEALLRLPFEARSRSRQRARLTDGTEVALVLPRGTVLRHGMVVGGAGLRVRIEAADEDLLEVRCDGSLALARAAYHLGNRHVPVQVDADRLLLGYDPVLADMLVGLGARIVRRWSPFEPESGAYGGHGH